MNSAEKKKFYKRVLIALSAVALAFTGLIARLIYLQVFEADELAEKQESYMLCNIEITATRGDIYDRNMNLLARDATCSMVYVFPNDVTDPENTADYLAGALGMTYDEVYADVTNVAAKYVVIKKGVENSVALAIEAQQLAGVGTSEDKKRNYADTEFAQYVLGFTGADHTGLYGIESVMDSVLSGENGVKTVLTDSQGKIIESSAQIKKEAVQGSSIALTLDSVIQYYAESAAYEGYLKNGPKRVIVIVSDPNTGEILAMAAYPSYSLANPWAVSDDYNTSYYYGDTQTTLGEKQLSMWSNPFTSFIYEPGSTFKGITVSTALEENVVSLDSRFYCGGSIMVSGVQLKCHVYPNSHGSESLTEAVINSCNPAFVEIGSKIGVDTFYKYIYNFGFGDKTGINLEGEESGILSPNQNVNIVDFATLAFGQGLGVTPVQMLQALNTVVNGGYLITPNVVKCIIDSDSEEITYSSEPNVVRQVISEETSATVRNILGAVGQEISSLADYRSQNIGGKTGTAQKYIDGSYAKGKYVASFYGIIPYDNPVLSVLVLVDEPSGVSTFGSTVAAPIGAKVLANAYSYMLSKDQIGASVIINSGAEIPDVRGKSLDEASQTLDSLGIAYNAIGDSSGTVVSQSPTSGEYMQGMVVELVVSAENADTVTVPDLNGMTVQSVKNMLSSLGLKLEGNGGGIAVAQDIASGTVVQKGTTIVVTFNYVE